MDNLDLFDPGSKKKCPYTRIPPEIFFSKPYDLLKAPRPKTFQKKNFPGSEVVLKSKTAESPASRDISQKTDVRIYIFRYRTSYLRHAGRKRIQKKFSEGRR